MSSSNPIGGYLELDLPRGEAMLHHDALLLNSGRSCFEYVLRAQKPNLVHLPKYTCDAMLEPLEKLDIPYSFYAINPELELADDIAVKPGELLVYNNYFGIKATYSRHLSQKYRDQLILDCSQAYYFDAPSTGHTFYSCRKFFGVPDGGCLYPGSPSGEALPAGTSYDRASHLLKRIDLGPEAAYADFQANEASLDGAPVTAMSPLTHRLLQAVDYSAAKRARLANFKRLHRALGDTNKLTLSIEDTSGPLVYPYLTNDSALRQKLIAHKIFVATYWPNVLEWSREGELEHHLATNLLALPIDQRYNTSDMERILAIIEGAA